MRGLFSKADKPRTNKPLILRSLEGEIFLIFTQHLHAGSLVKAIRIQFNEYQGMLSGSLLGTIHISRNAKRGEGRVCSCVTKCYAGGVEGLYKPLRNIPLSDKNAVFSFFVCNILPIYKLSTENIFRILFGHAIS